MNGATYGVDMIDGPRWPSSGTQHYRCKRHSTPKRRKRRLRKKILGNGYYIYCLENPLYFPWVLSDDEYNAVRQVMISLFAQTEIQ